jgi:hypothetical protein
MCSPELDQVLAILVAQLKLLTAPQLRQPGFQAHLGAVFPEMPVTFVI